MFRVGKLVKHRKSLDVVRAGDVLQVCMQREGVAGDVDNIVKVLEQLHSLAVQTCPRRVHLCTMEAPFCKVEATLQQDLEAGQFFCIAGGHIIFYLIIIIN